MPHFKQRDASDCGVTCLAYIFNHYRLRISPALLRQKAGTDKRGTTALGLVETAKVFGMEAKGIKCTFEQLLQVGLPAIAHMVMDSNRHHFVVITAIKKMSVIVMDPALGKACTWSYKEFQKNWTNVLVIMAPGSKFETGTRTQSGFRRLCGLLVMQKGIVSQAFAGAVLSTILSLAGAVFVQKIVDNVIVDGNRNLLNLLGTSMITLLVVRLILGYFQSFLMLRAAQRIDATIVLGYYRHLLRLPQSFFDTMRIGEINSRVSDAVQIRNFLNITFVSLILNPLILIFSFSAMFFYSWKLAMLSLAMVPFNGLIYIASDWRNKRYQREIMERSADFSSQIVESVHAMPVVRGFQLEEAMSLKIENRLVRLLKTSWKAAYMSLLVGSAGSFITQVYAILLLWIGASLVLDADMTVGQLMSCQSLAGYITGPIVSLIGMNTAVRQALIATERLYEIIDLERERDDGIIDLTPGDLRVIRLDNVSFKYPGRLHILHDLSLTINSGEITIITGPSGCGKTTLLSLLHRLHHPESGRIFADTINFENVRLASIRKMISILPQRVDLISGSIFENLAPGEPEPDLRRMSELCREVGILEFIESLPNGFSAHVTEGGTNLSGGQRQRLALVRALYLDAPVLLLDEPNSSLDIKSDDLLMRVLVLLRGQGKMVIVAAHSRRIFKVADTIIELRKGCIHAIHKRLPDGTLGEKRAGSDQLPLGPTDDRDLA